MTVITQPNLASSKACPGHSDGLHCYDEAGECYGVTCTAVGGASHLAEEINGDPVAVVGAMVIWRGMVKFPLQRGWIWLKRHEYTPGGVTAYFEDGISVVDLTTPEYRDAIAFINISPL